MNFRKIVILVFSVILFDFGGIFPEMEVKTVRRLLQGLVLPIILVTLAELPTKNNLFGIKDIELFNTRPSVYLGVRYKLRHNMAVKANFIYGFLKGSDDGSRPGLEILSDMCAFTSMIFEPSAQFEFSIII